MERALHRVGRRIRGIRNARLLSISDLARRASVAKATLAGLEQGRGNPTLETLMALAAALEVSLSALIDDEDRRTQVSVTRAGQGTEVRGEGLQLRCLHRRAEQTSLTEIHDLHAVKGVYTSAAHAQGVHEELIVHSGELEVGPKGRTEHLKPGDLISFNGDQPHLYRCLTEEARATLVVTYRLYLTLGSALGDDAAAITVR